MFAYIDPTIRARLIAQDKLVRIDARGRRIDAAASPQDSDPTLNILGPIPLPLSVEDEEVVLQWYAVVRRTELEKVDEIAAALRQRGDQRLFSMLASHLSVNSVLIQGEPHRARNPLVRVHSSCMTGDVFGSRRCECGPQFLSALTRIVRDPAGGILIYMSGHEGRGIGLWAKAVTYLLQDAGEDTYQANRSLGLPDDSRDFGDAAAMLLYFLHGDRPFRLMSNNPRKLNDLKSRGLTKISPVKHVVGVGEWNRRYLRAKRDWGHNLDDDDLTHPAEWGSSQK